MRFVFSSLHNLTKKNKPQENCIIRIGQEGALKRGTEMDGASHKHLLGLLKGQMRQKEQKKMKRCCSCQKKVKKTESEKKK